MRAVLYRIFYPARRMIWRVVRPRTFGVKCLIRCDGKILMIRNTYGRGHWTFPGGGIERNETPEHAVLREVREETGLQLVGVTPIGTYVTTKESKRDTVYCFCTTVDDLYVAKDDAEIAEIGWFAEDSLPDFTGPAVEKVLRLDRAAR